jgi:hypothetical protein
MSKKILNPNDALLPQNESQKGFTPIRRYWQIYHTLPEIPVPTNEELQKKMSSIITALEQTGKPLKSNVSRHAYIIAVAGYCPWNNSKECPCEEMTVDGRCKRGLFK